MKKVYLINAFIPRDMYDKGLKWLLTNNFDFRLTDLNSNTLSGIYAWTTSKRYAEDFIDLRDSSIYKIIPVELADKDEFKKFKLDNKDSMLEYRKYHASSTDDKKIIDILTTFNEFSQSVDFGAENMAEFGFSNINLVDYNIFKDSLITDLDILNYTYEFDRHHENPDIQEFADYNRGYGFSPGGHQIKFDTTNEVNVLLHLFKYFFSGIESVGFNK